MMGETLVHCRLFIEGAEHKVGRFALSVRAAAGRALTSV